MKRIIAAVSLITCLSVFFGSSLSAQTQEFHEFHIYPDVASTPLKLPWLSDNHNGRLIVVTPPSLGTFDAGKYSPSPEFWQVGFDRVALKVGGIRNPTIYTVLLTGMLQGHHILHLAVSTADFEDCQNSNCLPQFWEDDDPQNLLTLNSSSPLSGERSLDFWLPGANSTGYFTEVPNPFGGGGGTGSGANGTHQVEPPDHTFGAASTVIAMLGEVEVQVQFPDRFGPGGFRPDDAFSNGYMMRVAAPNNVHCTTCETPWRPVPYSAPINYKIWSGDKITSSDVTFPRPRGLRFSIEVEGRATTVDRLEGPFNAFGLHLGVLDSDGVEGLAGSYDNFETWREVYRYRPIGNITDGFEGSIRDTWVVDGPVHYSGAAALSGKGGVEVKLEELLTQGAVAQDAKLIDQGPNYAREVTALMRLDTSALNLGHGDSMRIMRSSNLDTLASGFQLSLILQRWNYDYRVQLVGIGNSSGLRTSAWYTLPDTTVDLAIQWRAADPGADNGQMRLWEGGTLVSEHLGLDNEGQRVESLGFGVFNLTFSGDVRVWPGTLRLDDLASISKF